MPAIWASSIAASKHRSSVITMTSLGGRKMLGLAQRSSALARATRDTCRSSMRLIASLLGGHNLFTVIFIRDIWYSQSKA
eukprot:Skav205673  [mRNA]  locus=scaffold458:673143:680558:- [translate_table: standard]